MTTRLATQRNFVTIRPVNNSSNKENRKQNNLSSNNSTIPTTEIIPIQIASVEEINNTNNENQNNSQLSIEEVIPKKIILQTSENANNVAVINVVPLDVSDSSNDCCNQTVGESDENKILSQSDGSSSSLAQQIGAQVTLVSSQANDDIEGQQYITVTVSTQEQGGTESYQVQYLNPDIYHNNAQNQSQMSYPFCAVGDYQSPNGQSSYYTTTSNYTSATNTATTHTSMPYVLPVDENILLSSSQSRDSPQNLSDVGYIPESAHNATHAPTSTTSTNSSQDSILEPKIGINHALRISPATVHWLLENYETADGVSLPRSLLYNHYKQHCDESKLEAVNAASFGKLIRSVFENLRTRRLGTRGNSKYHYYGIRLKAGSNLAHIMEEKPTCNYATNNTTNPSISKGVKRMGAKPDTFEACSQYLGSGAGAIPMLPNIDFDDAMLHEITLDDIEMFRSMYREHCELFLDAVLNLEFSSIESLWRDFWGSSDNNNIESCQDDEKYLPKSKLYLMCQGENIQRFIKEVDYAFYQNMVEVLIPDVLRSIPNSLTQAIRNFAKNLEIWLSEAMIGCPEKIIKIKTGAVSAFCQTLRRYTSLNHLAQAARAVLQNSSQIAQMLNDLNRVDFHNVQEQAAWVCQCDTAIVQKLENDFKAALQQQNTLEQWAAWLRLVVDSALEDYRGTTNYAKAARQFLLKWSFYSSMVIRDLTLRSASSFGSFHLIRLLYDEYMFFLIEHKVAEAQNRTAIAVMSDKMQRGGEFEFSYPMEISPNKRLKIEL